MNIEYLEIRDANREIIGIVDTAKSIIWHSVWYGVGDFEIYVKATPENVDLLQENRYVTKPYSGYDEEAGIIEKVQIIDSLIDGTMIIASGRFVKSILDRRLIYRLNGNSNEPTVLRGNVETAVRTVVANNAISCSFDSRRNISYLALGTLSNIPATIIDASGRAAQKQTSYDNLLAYTDSVLQEYGLSAFVYIDVNENAKKLKYKVKQGVDRSVDNTDSNEPIVFSKDYDNLTSSEYSNDLTDEKNAALIGGEGEGAERFYSFISASNTGLSRKEIWVDAQSIRKTLKASDLSTLFPTGVFSGVNFTVNGTIYATLEADLDKEYSLSSLQSDFPTGTVSGQKFMVSGVAYATLIYGETNKYNLTPLGYKAKLDHDDTEGNYILSDSVYKSMLDTQGKQILAQHIIQKVFNGVINISKGNYLYGRDFDLGDIVTIQENNLGIYVNVRIVDITELQDENGYSVIPLFEFVETQEDEPVVLNALLTESYEPIITEDEEYIMPESAALMTATAATSGVKISELPESTNVYDGCCMPIVTNGETKKIYYSLLKQSLGEDLGIEAMSNEDIDRICS